LTVCIFSYVKTGTVVEGSNIFSGANNAIEHGEGDRVKKICDIKVKPTRLNKNDEII